MPKRKRFALQSDGIKDYDFFLAFSCRLCSADTHCAVPVRELGLGSQAKRVARERRRPSVPEVGNTNVGTTHGMS